MWTVAKTVAMPCLKPGAIALEIASNIVVLLDRTWPTVQTKPAASLCPTPTQFVANCQANVSPPHKGLMPAWPSANSSGNVQASRFKVTWPVLRGKP